MHVIPCHCVSRIKSDVGSKVRIVAKDFRQVPKVQFHDTFAPVDGLSTVRLFLGLVSLLDLDCDQTDDVTAFLNGQLEEGIYMEVSVRLYDTSRPNLVC